MFEPEEILNHLELKDHMTAAEFGCGSGGLTIPLAKVLNKGRIQAIDILEEKIEALKYKADEEKIFNIQTSIRDLDQYNGSKLSNNSVDVVLIPNVLFQSESKDVMIKEAARVLKEEGQILIIDWKKESPLGNKGQSVDPEEVKKIAEETSLQLKKEFSAGPYHYGLIFKKQT